MATEKPRICHICSAITGSRNYCHSCGHALCPTCECEIPAAAADTHKAFVANDYAHTVMEGGVKYTSHDRTPPGEPITPEYASTAQSILTNTDDVKSQMSPGRSERRPPKFYFLPWFNPMKQLGGSLANNPFIVADQKQAQSSGHVESTPDKNGRAAVSESRHMSRWHATHAETLAEPLRKYQHKHNEKQKRQEKDEVRYSLTPEAAEIRSKLSSAVHPNAPAQTMKPRHKEWGCIQGIGDGNKPGSSGAFTEPGVIKRPDSAQSREMLLKRTSQGFVPVDSRSQSYCSVDEQPLLKTEKALAVEPPESEMSLTETVGSPVRAADPALVFIDSNSAIKELQGGNDHVKEVSTAESFTTAFQIHPGPGFLEKRHRQLSSETRIRREVNSISMRRESKGPGYPRTSAAPSIGIRGRRTTETTARITSKGEGQEVCKSYDAEQSLENIQIGQNKQHLQQTQEQIDALGRSFQELRQVIERRDKEASGEYDKISDESGPQTLEQTAEKHRLTPAALNAGLGRARQNFTPTVETEQRPIAVENGSDNTARFEEQLEAVSRQQQHHTINTFEAVGEEKDDHYYDDNHDCIWKAHYLALSAEVHQLREMMSERRTLSSASAGAGASGIEDTDSNFGLEGLTIVMHLKGKDDLVINTDLRER